LQLATPFSWNAWALALITSAPATRATVSLDIRF
jgi:hypothetical protein